MGGDFYIAGEAGTDGAGANDMLLVAFDGVTNEVEWTRLWGYFSSEYATALTTGPTGELLMTGNTTSLDPAGNTDIVLLTWDTGGTLLAARGWGRTGVDDTAAGLAADSGGVTLGGSTDLAGNIEALAIRFDHGGNQLWNSTWGGPGIDAATAILAGTNGAIVAAGILDSGGTGARGSLVYFDSTGTAVWDRAWSETPSRLGALAPAGGVMAIGGGAPAAGGNWESGVVSPVALEDCTLALEGYEINAPVSSLLVPTGVAAEPTGFTEDTGGGGGDALLVRYNPGSTI